MSQPVLAYGIEPGRCKYELRLARYVDFARRIQEERKLQGRTLKVLDLGCGIGRMILYTGTEGLEWYGMDQNESDLISASRQGPYTLKQGDICQALPYKDEEFDVVVLSHVLEHIDDPHRVIQNARRVIKKGGVLLVGVPIFTFFTAWFRKYVVTLFDRAADHHGRSHVFFFTVPSLRKALDGFGMSDVRGFRFFSASKKLPLENSLLFYKLSTGYGRLFPNLTAEINCTARRTS
jgi:SAM-dependent methyltransferase